MAVVAILGLLAIIAGIIILYVSAFRAHLVWGILLIVLAPIILPVFVVRHWRLARGGLLLLFVGLVTVSYVSYSEAQWPPHRYLLGLTQPEKLGTLGRVLWGRRGTETDIPATAPQASDTQSQQLKKLENPQSVQPGATTPIATDKPSAETIDSASQLPENKVRTRNGRPPPEVMEKIAAQEQAAAPVKYVEVDLEDLPAYFGMQVRLTEVDGRTHEGVLKDQDGPQLVLEKSYAAGGVVEFMVVFRNVVKLEAMRSVADK
jgi:hypothetical protein